MILSDITLGLRMLRRRPVVACGAVLSLALGIGANTAIFSVFHRVVLNPLPYRAPEELVAVWETSADTAERWVAPANFVDWRRDTTSFSSLAAYDEFRPTMTRLSVAVTIVSWKALLMRDQAPMSPSTRWPLATTPRVR